MTLKKIDNRSIVLDRALVRHKKQGNYRIQFERAQEEGDDISKEYEAYLKNPLCKQGKANTHYNYAMHAAGLRTYYYLCYTQDPQTSLEPDYLASALKQSKLVLKHLEHAYHQYVEERDKISTKKDWFEHEEYHQAVLAAQKERDANFKMDQLTYQEFADERKESVIAIFSRLVSNEHVGPTVQEKNDNSVHIKKNRCDNIINQQRFFNQSTGSGVKRPLEALSPQPEKRIALDPSARQISSLQIMAAEIRETGCLPSSLLPKWLNIFPSLEEILVTGELSTSDQDSNTPR